MFLDSDYNLKLGDFGFCCSTSEVMHECYGTLGYMAPEILAKEPYKGVEVDLFALGVSLFMMVSGNFPFKKAEKVDIFYSALIKNDNSVFWRKHSKQRQFSDEFKTLIVYMLQFDPHDRLSIQEIL